LVVGLAVAFVTKAIPAMIRLFSDWGKERKQHVIQKCRDAVADILRAEKDFGLTKTEILSRIISTCDSEDVDEALRYFEREGMIYLSSSDKWVWKSSKLSR
jgi:hypothetical protein